MFAKVGLVRTKNPDAAGIWSSSRLHRGYVFFRFDTKEEAIDHLRQSHPGNEQQHCLRVEQPVSKPNEKPFTYKLFYCDFCWKEFTWRANLVRHINIHTHEKIFPCSTCKKTFRYVVHYPDGHESDLNVKIQFSYVSEASRTKTSRN